MKGLQHILGTLPLALSLTLLASCDSDKFQTPQPASDIANIHSNEKTAFSPQLLKDGKKELQYYDQYHVSRGKLWKVIDGLKGEYTEYQYNGLTITAQRKKISSNSLLYQVTYKLDAAGKCVETYHSQTQKTFSYIYNQYGQLTKAYDQVLPNNRMEFTYNGNHDLTTITYFDQTNVKTKLVNYYYTVQGGNPMQNNYHINPGYVVNDAEYLPIFGKFYSLLYTIKGETNLAADGSMASGWTKSYTYTFNAFQVPSSISETPYGSNTADVRTLTYTTPKL